MSLISIKWNPVAGVHVAVVEFTWNKPSQLTEHIQVRSEVL